MSKDAEIDDVKDLVARGKEKGWLTADEIADSLGGLELSAEQVDNVYALIAEESIEVFEQEPGSDAEEVDLAMRIEAGLWAEEMLHTPAKFDVARIKELAIRSKLEAGEAKLSEDKA